MPAGRRRWSEINPGQEVVVRDGFYTLDFDAVAAEAKKLGIELKPAQ